MTKRQKLELEQSETRQRLNDLLQKDELETPEKTELENFTKRMQELEPLIRACIVAEGEPLETREQFANGLDAEQRERLELRSKASVTNYLKAFMSGKMPTGAEGELMEAAGVDGLPLEIFDTKEVLEKRADVTTGTPSSVGVNLQPIQPSVFSHSIAPRLGVSMPRVPSGSFSSATITGNLSAAPKAKGAAQESSAATFSVSTVTPKRISARLSIAMEDIAAVGQANFESALRQNLSLVLSDALDAQLITGDGTAPNINGLLTQLTDAAVPPSGVTNWTQFCSVAASGIDGKWSTMLSDVCLLVGPETYRLASTTFQGTDSEESAATYLGKHGGFFCNSRMPDKENNIQKAILYKKGRHVMGGSMGMQTAICGTWGSVTIDDIYSSSASGLRHLTLHTLVSDIILVQPNVYEEVSFRVSS